jgi:phosphoribosyl 1,2-cyclic phosphodiesterase
LERRARQTRRFASFPGGTPLAMDASNNGGSMTIQVRFWGVRGSIAAPGPDTCAVGGNTSAVELRCGDARIICDAGTGLRALGDSLLAGGVSECAVLLSHQHWDHIQGLPFFVPLYVPGTSVALYGAPERSSLREVLAGQMAAPVFPVRLDQVAAKVDTCDLRPGQRFGVFGATLTTCKLNHPGGSLAYRVDYEGSSVVYATDTEHYACVDPVLRELSRGADILIYDSQYTPAEYEGQAGPSKLGWGHSTYEHGVRLARAADVGEYVLFHHDPRRSDAAVAELEMRAQELFPRSVAAREGMTLETASKRRAA